MGPGRRACDLALPVWAGVWGQDLLEGSGFWAPVPTGVPTG